VLLDAPFVRFALDEMLPVWTYALGDALLERRIWMVDGANTTYLMCRLHGEAAVALGFLRPFVHHLSDAGLGSISEIFDGDPPHPPRGCIAQAWSVAEGLRVWKKLTR
jgi:glycogen debranching enzyme